MIQLKHAIKVILITGLFIAAYSYPVLLHAQNNPAAFKKAIAFADSVYKVKDYKNALAAYTYAARLNSGDKVVNAKILELQRVVNELNNNGQVVEKLLQNCEKLIKAGKIQEAGAELLNATKLSAGQTELQSKISELNKKIAAINLSEKNYTEALDNGNKLLNINNFDEAIAAFQMAKDAKPAEKTPDQKIAEAKNRKDANKQLYDKEIALGDGFYTSDQYDQAITHYSNAAKLLPREKYPTQKIKDISDIKNYSSTLEKDYEGSVKEGDIAFEKGDYVLAAKKYKASLDFRPDEEYPKNKLKQIQTIAADNTQKAILYANYIKNADEYLKSNSLKEAFNAYSEASGLMPAEKYPKDKIKELQPRIAAVEKSEDQYKALILSAESSYNSADYLNAKTAYTSASKIKPEETLPKDKLAEIEQILNKQKELNTQFNQLLANGLAKFNAKQYDAARSTYLEALAMKPGEKVPTDKIAEIDQIISQQKNLQENYDLALTNGDNELGKGNLVNALGEFNKALLLKPGESYPLSKKAEIEKSLAQQKGNEQNYTLHFKNGEKLSQQKKLTEAKDEFLLALTFKPGDVLATGKISGIEQLLAEQKSKQEQYDQLIKNGNDLFAENKYPEALAAFNSAILLKPGETYPATKVREINSLITKAENLEKTFKTFVENADKLLAASEFIKAKTEFGKALDLKPENEYSANKIKQIDSTLAQIAILEAKYTEMIANADGLLNAGKLSESKDAYLKALEIKKNEAYPIKKIGEIDRIFSEMAQKDANYQKAVISGNQYFTDKKYDEALTEFNRARQLKQEEELPKQKITEITAILEQIKLTEAQYKQFIAAADGDFMKKNLAPAKDSYTKALNLKPDASYPVQKIKSIDSLIVIIEKVNNNYAEAIKTADQLFDAGKLNDALIAYNNAASIKSEEEYPKTRISLVNKLILDKKQAEDDAFNLAFNNGELLLKSKSYEKAKTEFKSALLIKPDSKAAMSRITEIDQTIVFLQKQELEYQVQIRKADSLNTAGQLETAVEGYKKSLEIKPEEAYPKAKIAELGAIILDKKDKETQFKKHTTDAENFTKEGKITEAVNAYKNALSIKPTNEEVKSKIALLDAEIQKLAQAEVAYNAAIVKAEAFVKAGQLKEALLSYENAITIKPNDQAATLKAEGIRQEIKNAEELEAAYKQQIIVADSAFETSDYQKATLYYSKGQEIKPKEIYPSERIKEINKILANKQLIESKYNTAMLKADSCFKTRLYNESLSQYLTASRLKPAENSPKERIEALNQLLTRPKEVEGITYEKAMNAAEIAFNKKEMDKAFDNYLIAMHLEPHQTIPSLKVNSIIDEVSSDTVVKILSKPMILKAGTNATFNFEMLSGMSKVKNYLIIKLIEPAKDDAKVVVNFGKTKNVTGGLVMRILGKEKITTYIGFLSGQGAWKDNVNNFFTLLAERGDINIKEIYISTVK